MGDDGLKVDVDELKKLAERFHEIPQDFLKKKSRQLIKKALKETGARKSLQGYIKSHFKKHTGLFNKSVSTEKTSKVKQNKNRVVAYTFFKGIGKTLKKGSHKNQEIQPRTRARWCDQGTRPHATGKGSRLGKTEDVYQRMANNYQVKISNNKIKLSKSRTIKEREKYQGRIDRLTAKFIQLKNTRYGKQKGAVVKGITAHHFIESIQRNVDSKAEAITLKLLQECVADYLNKR